jgi:hypothetical protein
MINAEDQAQISKLIRAKRCALWPDCSCRSTLIHWQDKLLNDYKGWGNEQLRWAETSIFITLSCVAHRCPDRKIKTWAMIQLLNPWWDRQKRNEEMSDEFIEERRREHQRKQEAVRATIMSGLGLTDWPQKE